ncbi:MULTISPECIES: hypothetical protein [Clostridium]|uniref:Uncharacterized protein n=1 Tax=Clostridium cibarium TaxID=2762247 RepID=A0ABR8PSR5_9CLOT|nr:MULTISPECIES: hypothetical protein [Clostridium]MBD7911218.1 hypothetical protein [Clostridium cibarium]
MIIIQWLMKIWYLLTYRFKREKLYIIKAQLSGEGAFIDIRYRITRPDRVKGIENIYLVDEESKKKFYLMKLPRYGAIQTKHRKYQYTGILLFQNFENTIKSGSKITLVFGKLEVKGIIIK